ncbi:glycosyltransferase family 2 protein, partial [Streptococcus suis]
SGDYILFLDCDDFWTYEHFLDEINEELHSQEEVVDAVIYPFSYWYCNADIRVRDFPQKLPRHEIITDSFLLVETVALIAPVCNKCV